MKKNVGIWINHREAKIVVVTDDGDEGIMSLESNVERHERYGKTDPAIPFKTPFPNKPDDIRDRKFAGHINAFYDKIISLVNGKDSKSIFILGPGEAKGELKKRFEHIHPHKYSITIEAADHITDNRIIETVRRHFGVPTRNM